MTISTRIVLGISATALAFSLALAPVALANDPMSQDIDFRNSLSRGDGVRKDTMARDTVTRDTVSRGPTKKDDAIRKYGVSK